MLILSKNRAKGSGIQSREHCTLHPASVNAAAGKACTTSLFLLFLQKHHT